MGGRVEEQQRAQRGWLTGIRSRSRFPLCSTPSGQTAARLVQPEHPLLLRSLLPGSPWHCQTLPERVEGCSAPRLTPSLLPRLCEHTIRALRLVMEHGVRATQPPSVMLQTFWLLRHRII